MSNHTQAATGQPGGKPVGVRDHRRKAELMPVAMMLLMAALTLSAGASPASAERSLLLGHGHGGGCASVLDVAGSAAAVTSQSALASSCDPARQVSIRQDDCTMAVLSRGVWMDVLRPMVPDRYGLRTATAAPGRPPGPYSSIFIIDQYCESVVVHGRHSVPTTTTHVVAPITTTDGQPSTGTLYTIYIGTDNPELFALYRSAGLPAEFLPDNATTITQVDSTTTEAVFTIQGGQFDHEFTVLGYPPVEPYVIDTGARWLYEAQRGRLSLVWDNDVQPNAPAVVSGSIEADTTLAQLVPDFIHTMNGARFASGYRTGNVVQTLTCDPEG